MFHMSPVRSLCKHYRVNVIHHLCNKDRLGLCWFSDKESQFQNLSWTFGDLSVHLILLKISDVLLSWQNNTKHVCDHDKGTK